MRSVSVTSCVLPLQFMGSDSFVSLGITGDEEISISGLDDIHPQQELTLEIKRKDGTKQQIKVKSRIDTSIEVDYYKHGGILPYVLRELISKAGPAASKAA